MAQSSDRSTFLESLPSHPSLDFQQKRAKRLLRDAHANDPAAWQRIDALHPSPPVRARLTLADAQLVVARGYGFVSWTDLRRKIESLTQTPVQQFVSAIRAGDAARVKELLDSFAEVRESVNAPLGAFGGRPVNMARKKLDVLDALLAYGADLNLKSEWAMGPFGILESDITLAEAQPLIARGAVVDIFAAAHLGLVDRVQALVDADPSLVRARGGDGKTALHCARTVEIAGYLLDRGAEIDARCVDHQSTAAQYLVRDAPDVARFLVDRGAWIDIFLAVGLRDAALVERCLAIDPPALDHRTWQGLYRTVPPLVMIPAEERARLRGDIYRWVFGHNVSAMDAARLLGFNDLVALLRRHATPRQNLLAACAAADRSSAEAIMAAHPGLVSTLPPEDLRLIADRAHAGDTAAVLLMLDVGFDPLARGTDEFEAIRWAVFLGNAELTRALLAHRPPLNTPDPSYGGTLLGNCLYGALHGWAADSGDFVTTVRLLLDAGEVVGPKMAPTGLDAIDELLRAYQR